MGLETDRSFTTESTGDAKEGEERFLAAPAYRRQARNDGKCVDWILLGLEVVKEVANGFGVVMDGGAAYFGEIEAGVEGVGGGIGRVEIDFAADASVSGGFGALKKFCVEGAGVAFAAGGWRSYYAIDVDEIGVGVFFGVRVLLEGRFEESSEPEKVDVLVARRLIEGDEQSFGIVDGGGEKGFADQ